ncbi:GNAT family N-acetyltransferase [Dyella japonica]|jgi:GNAT superfamily N-acetyltransferase|uniref:GCN5 family acetyltransferase n=1 Tax=Dyella japonica DSM 16301 TaxID=1440762 RepID=A0A0G9H346_9GAMM|nr:GNAT family N-acetyltransferase [Dyella japonica]KLD63926.1 GCN5 family acetyltransferase [Dyella japonica DSM 16301]
MSYELHAVDAPDAADREAIAAPLRAYNLSKVPTLDIQPLVIALRDAQGRTIGGLWGETALDWLHIDLLGIPESMRGQDVGTALLLRAEEIARERGCVGAWLDTFAFQARGFYEKLGYSVFGEIPDHPVGGARYFLRKRF